MKINLVDKNGMNLGCRIFELSVYQYQLPITTHVPGICDTRNYLGSHKSNYRTINDSR